jgi:putative ABC transport system permease protein
MWKATIRAISARKLRLALTTLAVLLGVTFVTGTYVLTDTIRSAFDDAFAQTEVGIDLVARARDPFVRDPTERIRVPDTLTDQVAAVDGVATADGVVQGYAQFVDKEGDGIQHGGAPTLGASYPQSGEGPLRLVDDGRSRPPRAPDEVLMDSGTAERHDFEVGDVVQVLLDGPAQRFEIVGLFGVGDRLDVGGVTFAVFDLATGQEVFAAPGALDAVNVTVEPGASVEEVARRIQAAGGPAIEVVTPRTVTDERAEPVREGLGLLRYGLVGFAAVGLVVGSFIIFNTFTILVAQRTRELGLLRALGASGRQVMVSVVGEAAVIGIVGSVVGLLAGIVAGSMLLDQIERLGWVTPPGPTVVLARTVIAAFAVGLGVTVVSSVIPAIRASRTSPVAAINDTVQEAVVPRLRRAVWGVCIALVGVVFLVIGFRIDSSDIVRRIQVIAVGAMVMFLGVVVLIATFARPLARIVGWPLSRQRITGRLARGNAMRNPRRTAATASALVVGLSLVCLVAIFSSSMKASISRGIEGGVKADFVLSADQLVGFSPQLSSRVSQLPAVGAATPLRLGKVDVGSRDEVVMAVDPTAIDQMLDLDVSSGSIGNIAGGGIMIPRNEAERYDTGVGGSIRLTFPRTGPIDIPVVAVYERFQFTGGFPVPLGVMSISAHEGNFGGTQQDSLVYVKSRPGQFDEARRQVNQLLRRDFPNVDLSTREGFESKQQGMVDQYVSVLVGLLIFSEIIAILGIVNTLLLSVYERTRELGLLRVVGMSRRQVRNMVRGESVIIAVIGAVLGLAVGVFWGWAFVRALQQEGITEFDVPPLQVAGFMAFSVVAGIVAALIPAWRAARLDVLEAIAEE